MKRLLSLCLILCCFPFFSVSAETPEVLTLSAPSAILIEAGTGQVLYEQNSHDKRPPASVTKIMTMLLVMEAIDSGQITQDEMVQCSEFAASMGGSQVYLEPGEEMSVRDMLKAVAVASGNDAAVALAEHVAGSHEAFVSLMNERAKELGMNDTHFVNCNGLDTPEHVTSAYDIALMSRELVRYPLVLEFTGIWMDSLRNGEFGLVNTNKLIRFYEGANGLKTGSTSVAKYCLSASAVRGGMNLIAVVLGSETSKDRFSDASKLLDYGFANFAVADSLLTPEELAPLAVEKGLLETVQPGIDKDFHILVSKSKINRIEKQITLPSEVRAPIREGDILGKVIFTLEGEQIGETDIVATETVEKQGVFGMFKKLTNQLFFGRA